MTAQNSVVDGTASVESTPPPEMHEALALVERIGGNELLQKVITLFRSTSQQRVEAMRAAALADERHQLSRLAHAMKGSAAQVGAESLRAAAASLEKEAAGLAADAITPRLDALSFEVTRAWAQLDAYGRTAGGFA